MLKPVVTKIKKTVSGDRRRHQEDGYDLDLSYIQNNIIAMSFPAAGIEATWRNHIDHVVNFLKKNHGQNFMIWNLSERTYNFDKFDNQILHLPFSDHHPPPLTGLFQIVQTIDNWIRADKRNVSVIHCVGGKGRTGTVISSCLYFNGIFKTIQESIDYFAKMRSALSRGVTQPSQRRYVQYFAKVLTQMKPMRLTKVRLVSVAVGPLSASKEFGLEVYDSPYKGKLLYMSYPPPGALLNFDVNIDVKGDIYIKFTEKSAKHTKKDRFFIVLHASFVTQKHYHFNKRNLDTLEFDKRFAENLSVGIKFGPPQSPSEEPEVDSVIETMRQVFMEERSAESGQVPKRPINGVVPSLKDLPQPTAAHSSRPSVPGADESWSSAKPNKRLSGGPSGRSKSTVEGSDYQALSNSAPLERVTTAEPHSHNRDRSNGYCYTSPVQLDTITSALRKIEIHKRRVSQLDHQLKNAMTALSDKNATTSGADKTPPSVVRTPPTAEKARANKQNRSGPQTTKLSSVPKAIVLYNFQAQYPEELSINKGDVVRITAKDYAEWFYGYVEDFGMTNASPKKGYFPRKYVQLLGAG